MKRLSETELAEFWGKTTRTLQLWRKNGKGPRFIKIGDGSILYREEDILAYEEACAVGTPIPPAGWNLTVKRAASAFNKLATQSRSEDAKRTLYSLRDELNALINKPTGEAK